MNVIETQERLELNAIVILMQWMKCNAVEIREDVLKASKEVGLQVSKKKVK
jgi:hypothetical protein